MFAQGLQYGMTLAKEAEEAREPQQEETQSEENSPHKKRSVSDILHVTGSLPPPSALTGVSSFKHMPDGFLAAGQAAGQEIDNKLSRRDTKVEAPPTVEDCEYHITKSKTKSCGMYIACLTGAVNIVLHRCTTSVVQLI